MGEMVFNGDDAVQAGWRCYVTHQESGTEAQKQANRKQTETLSSGATRKQIAAEKVLRLDSQTIADKTSFSFRVRYQRSPLRSP